MKYLPVLSTLVALACTTGAPEESKLEDSWSEYGQDDDGDGSLTPEDCDDHDPSRNPTAQEIWYDGIDQDCQGDDDYDADADHSVPEAYVGRPTEGVEGSGGLLGGDCWDDPTVIPPAFLVIQGWDLLGVALDWRQPSANEVYQGAAELWYDGVDQDCDYADDLDQDGDGFRTFAYPDRSGVFGTDCIDGAPLDAPNEAGTEPSWASPGAKETWYDGTDQDCDGNDCDLDLDGYCLSSYGFTLPGDLAAGDCDDEDPAVHPGAAETALNGKDEDCDGLDACWLDADADGYLPSEPLVVASKDLDCDDPSEGGSESPRDDCDDYDPTIYPDAPEICADGLDQDCDGLDRSCRVSGEFALGEFSPLYIGELARDRAGFIVAAGGDTDGDGRDEVLVGTPDQYFYWGAVYLIEGPPWDGGRLDDTDVLKVRGESEQDTFGIAVDTLGDMNSDGFDDLVVGANNADPSGAGAAYVITGPIPPGSVATVGFRLYGEASPHQAGVAVAGPGDVNGDDVPDILVGADYEDTVAYASGAAYLLLGPVSADMSLADSDAILRGGREFTYAGREVDGGDLDGDGLADLVIGGNGWDGIRGAVWVRYGPVSGELELDDVDFRVVGEAVLQSLGYSVSSGGDLNGDGYDDLAIGANGTISSPSDMTGAVYIFHGPLHGNVSVSAAEASFSGVRPGDYAGNSVAIDGDADGDGLSDLLVGAMTADLSRSGVAYLFYGPISGSGDLDLAPVSFVGTSAGSRAGSGVAWAGDLDLDGSDDIVIGMERYEDFGAVSILVSSDLW